MEQKIKDKLEKLLRLKEGAEEIGNQAEAENAAQRIQEMLLKYNLDLEDVKGSEDKPQIVRKDIYDLTKKDEGEWINSLFKVLSDYNLCKVAIIERKYKPSENFKGGKVRKFAVIGLPHNIEIMEFTLESLINQIRSLEKKAWKEYEGQTKKKAFRRGFFMGIVAGIDEKLAQNYEKQMEDERTQALVKKQDAELQKAFRKEFPDAKSQNAKNSYKADGVKKGYQDSNKVNINPGINKENKGNSSRILK